MRYVEVSGRAAPAQTLTLKVKPRRTTAIRLLAATAAGIVLAQAPPAERLRGLTAEVARITGFEVRRPVPVEVLSRTEWKRYVEQEIGKEVREEELLADQTTLRLFGLVPPDFDLKQATIDLLGEQAAAIYDHRRKKMLLLGDGQAGPMEDAILVHELAHALADQHYDMRRFLDRGVRTGEQQAARLAVVEGQAMWVMLDWQLGRMGLGSVAGNRAALERMLPAIGSMAAASYPVFASAPLYLKETLLFPYTAGVVFHQTAVERFGPRAFRRVLEKPPETTHQILHPEAWLAGSRYRPPPAPVPPRESDYRRVSAGILGEFDIRVLLKQYCGPEAAERLGPAWRGGSYELLEHRQTRRPALRWAVGFAEEAAATDFLGCYRSVLEGKSRQLEWEARGRRVLQGRNSSGSFRIEVRGAAVGGLEALQPEQGRHRPAL